MKNQINSEVLHVAARTLKTGIGVCQRKKGIEIVEKVLKGFVQLGEDQVVVLAI